MDPRLRRDDVGNLRNRKLAFYNPTMPRLFTRAVDEFTFYRDYAKGMEGRFGPGIMKTGASWSDYYFLLLVNRDERVLAAVKLLVNDRCMYAAYLETAWDEKGHRYGRRLFSRMFSYAARQGVEMLELSQYSRYGQEYLAPREEKLSRRFYPDLHVVPG